MLGIRVDSLLDDAEVAADGGWNEEERSALQTAIRARQPFLDFPFSRILPDGSKYQYRVSGEPMFNQACRLVGYRGIGIRVGPTH
jgi:hypothetical protein